VVIVVDSADGDNEAAVWFFGFGLGAISTATLVAAVAGGAGLECALIGAKADLVLAGACFIIFGDQFL
jgi:hypothetical protein